MESKIKEILADEAYTSDIRNNLSLYSGIPGYILLAHESAKKEETFLEPYATDALQHLVDHHDSFSNATFAGGKAGVHWLYGYLLKSGLIEEEDYEVLCGDNTLLQQYTLGELSHGNWDFLHGAIGVAYALLFRYKETDEAYFREVFRELKRLCDNNEVTGTFPGYDFQNDNYIKEETDLGLAHGLPSVLKFCVQCYKQGVCAAEARELGDRIIDFLLSHTNPHQSVAYFSPGIKKGVPYTGHSRLGWCYGDLGVGIVLYQAAKAFNYDQLATFAVDILKHSATRRKPEDTRIWDAGICHGSAGVAHIYNRMWHYTQDTVFKDAAAYWISQTLNFSAHEEGVGGYKRYTHGPVTWVSDGGLLEGAAGIGLVLLSYIIGDFSWDYCIMLND